MKLGILTFHSVDNFGAVLQAFALQHYLESQGHEVEIIDYRPAYFEASRKWSWRPDRMLGRFLMNWQARKFEDFRRRYLKRTAPCWTAKDLEANLPRYDAVIVGSDQVWSPDVDRRKETDPIYFFRWDLPSGTRKIAYAASFGTDRVSAQHIASVQEGLSNIDVISVREATGVGIVKELTDRDAKWVCDPVFLLSGAQWRKLAAAPESRGKEIMVYMPPAMGVLQALARQLHTKVVLPGWNVLYLLKRRLGICFPSPLQWVSRIAASRGVITKSFHGTAFCILTHTPFVYIRPSGSAGSRATRVVDLLVRLGLSARMVDEDTVIPVQLANLLRMNIDWQSVENSLKSYCEDSQVFLRAALGRNDVFERLPIYELRRYAK